MLEVLGDRIENFERRDGQFSMYEDVLATYENGGVSLIEAGTGIGKSYAYLVAALHWFQKSGEPTIIATHTIALQEQLIQKDIPLLLDALDLECSVVILKGMSNYLCLRKLEDQREELPESVVKWATRTKEGTKSELPQFQDFEEIGADRESCTSVKCPHYKECFFFKAKQAAKEAHLLIINHHLLCADMSVRKMTGNDDQFCILPPLQHIVIDEAHHLEDVATEYFAHAVSRYGLIRQLGRITGTRGQGKLALLRKKVIAYYPEGKQDVLEKLDLSLPHEKRNLVDQIEAFFQNVREVIRGDDKVRLHPSHYALPGWREQLQPQVEELFAASRSFIEDVELLDCFTEKDFDTIIADLKGITRQLEVAFHTLYRLIFEPPQPDEVAWVEKTERNTSIVCARLDIAEELKDSLFDKAASIILTSATLKAGKDFSFIKERLGIEEAGESTYLSPFNYEEQVTLYLPENMPEPSHPRFTEAAVAEIGDILRKTEGGAFVLFTSYQMLKEVAERVRDQISYPLLCQGENSRTHLLDAFREDYNAVLFGTDSFWEGVDVAGDSLRCVIIVKLPFKVPSDPIFQARSEKIEREGNAPFFAYALPQAVVKFKQGFGRLIRHQQDRGMVVCLDRRLTEKNYGKVFLKNIPKCRQTKDISATYD